MKNLPDKQNQSEFGEPKSGCIIGVALVFLFVIGYIVYKVIEGSAYYLERGAWKWVLFVGLPLTTIGIMGYSNGKKKRD